MSEPEDRLRRLEGEIERRLTERFAALRDEFDRLRLESDQRWAGFLDRFEQDFRGLVPPELVAAAAAPPAQAGGLLSVEDLRSLEGAENQVEALRRFLELLRRHASRAVLLVSRSGSLGAWKTIGFSERGQSDEAIRRLAIPLDEGLFSRALQGTPLRLGKENAASTRMGAAGVERAVLVPMAVKEKISGLVYADCVAGEEEGFHPETIALLTYVSGLIVDRLSSRKLKPAPALQDFESLEALRAQTAPAGTEAELLEELEPVEEMKPPEVRPPSFAVVPQPSEPAVRIPVTAEEAAPPALEKEPERYEELEEPLEREAPRPEPAPSAATVRLPEIGPAAETGARRLVGPLAPPEGDERREEARRFARLLISEIKLYNERVVAEGREHGNLYQRLREDIDRSRQMYDQRIPEDVRASSNFFYEELVRVLADGRAEALGL